MGKLSVPEARLIVITRSRSTSSRHPTDWADRRLRPERGTLTARSLLELLNFLLYSWTNSRGMIPLMA